MEGWVNVFSPQKTGGVSQENRCCNSLQNNVMNSEQDYPSVMKPRHVKWFWEISLTVHHVRSYTLQGKVKKHGVSQLVQNNLVQA